MGRRDETNEHGARWVKKSPEYEASLSVWDNPRRRRLWMGISLREFTSGAGVTF